MALAVALGGCGGAATAPGACRVTLSGNTSAYFELASCAKVTDLGSDGGAGGVKLAIDTRTSTFGRVTASFALEAATPGQYGSASSIDWSALALSVSSSCTFSAGRETVPTGSFSLRIDEIDAAAGIAHGHVDLVTWVHAPRSTDCGDGDLENIAIDF